MILADIPGTLWDVAPVIGIVAVLALLVGLFSRLIFPPKRRVR